MNLTDPYPIRMRPEQLDTFKQLSHETGVDFTKLIRLAITAGLPGVRKSFGLKPKPMPEPLVVPAKDRRKRVQTAITIPEELLTQIDELALKEGLKRSAFIGRCMERAVEKRRQTAQSKSRGK